MKYLLRSDLSYRRKLAPQAHECALTIWKLGDVKYELLQIHPIRQIWVLLNFVYSQIQTNFLGGKRFGLNEEVIAVVDGYFAESYSKVYEKNGG